MSFNPGGGGGISGASDVALNNPTNDQALAYNSTTQKWANRTLSGSATDATTSAKGVVQLAGDLGGTATVPRVPGLASRLAWKGDFASGTTYAVNDVIVANGATYRCQTAHTAGPGAPATNGDATFWERIGTISGGGAISTHDDLPLSVPGTVTWTGSAWPARSTVTSQATRRIFYVGNPGGIGPTDMQENDIWIQG